MEQLKLVNCPRRKINETQWSWGCRWSLLGRIFCMGIIPCLSEPPGSSYHQYFVKFPIEPLFWFWTEISIMPSHKYKGEIKYNNERCTYFYMYMYGRDSMRTSEEGHACIYHVNEAPKNADHCFGHSDSLLLLALWLFRMAKHCSWGWISDLPFLPLHRILLEAEKMDAELHQHWKPGLSSNGLPDTGKNVSNHHTDGVGLTH